MYSVDEIIEQIDQDSDAEVVEETQEDENETEDAGTSTKVAPKIKRKRGSRPKLDVERLKGPRGLLCMEKYFSDLKFKGNGHEKQDLKQVMDSMQFWCHRLFPKFTFDDSLAQLEKLGTKKPVITLKTKIIHGMIEEDPPAAPIDIVDVDDDTESQQEVVSEFDLLLNQGTTSLTTTQPAVTAKVVELTEEQKEMIERNRQLAAERRRARLEAMKQKEDEITASTSSQALSSSHPLNLTEEQKLIIEKNRLLAIEKRKQLQNKSISSQFEDHSTQNSSQKSSENENEPIIDVDPSQENSINVKPSETIMDVSDSEENNSETENLSPKSNEISKTKIDQNESKMDKNASQENSESLKDVADFEKKISEIDNLSSKSDKISKTIIDQNESEMEVDASQENSENFNLKPSESAISVADSEENISETENMSSKANEICKTEMNVEVLEVIQISDESE